MTEQAEREIPWPGPRPYEERHWRNFYGRAAEVRRVISNVAANALSVLLGGSGTGKTSLVRAGAVPELRNRRYHPRGSLDQWPVLVLRRWGAESGTTIDRILHDQLVVSIDAIDEWGRREKHPSALKDAELFRSRLNEASRTDAITDTLLRLARSNGATDAGRDDLPPPGGLILVFDQFEELLRPGGQTASDAIAVIQELYQRGAKNVHMLLSLRQEFVYALRELESTVGGLAGRSIVLSPMRKQTVLEVIRDASKMSDVHILEDAASQIVEWLGEAAARRRGTTIGGAAGTGGGSSGLQLAESAATPDLLKLQAVLWELFQFAQIKEHREVDLTTLKAFEDDARARKGDQATGDGEWGAELIVEGALERWIEEALGKSLAESPIEPLAETGPVRSFEALTGKLPNNDLNRQVKRIAIRLAPHLTALDYKVPQEENALFRLALGDDIWRLGMKNARNRDKIRIVDEEVPRLNSEALEISENLLPGEQHFLSGLAKASKWSPAETGDRLAACFREALHRLKQGNILTRIVKVVGEERSSVWELVHDQFGPTFLKWSHEHKDSWYDCESSFTVSNGIQPIMVPGDRLETPEADGKYTLGKISWRGCSIEPGRHDLLVLRDVHFDECFLVGTIFDRCRFEGCSFKDCELNGALFRRCQFVDGNEGPTLFEKCDASSLAIVESTIEGLQFRNCELQQPTIMAVLDGQVCFTQGSRVAQAYFEVERGQGADPGIVFEHKSRAFFCSANLESLELIDYRTQQDVASGAVPWRFFNRRAKLAAKDKF